MVDTFTFDLSLGIRTELGIPWGTPAIKQFSVVSQSNCPKRTATALLYIPTEALLVVAFNLCNPPRGICLREGRDPSQGKQWALCNGIHSELGTLASFLVHLRKLPIEEYLDFVAEYPRWKFGSDEELYYDVIGKYRANFDRETQALLAGSFLTLADMTYMCKACSHIVNALKICVPARIKMVGEEENEPSTSTSYTPPLSS